METGKAGRAERRTPGPDSTRVVRQTDTRIHPQKHRHTERARDIARDKGTENKGVPPDLESSERQSRGVGTKAENRGDQTGGPLRRDARIRKGGEGRQETGKRTQFLTTSLAVGHQVSLLAFATPGASPFSLLGREGIE
jgi:hypothetical protein